MPLGTDRERRARQAHATAHEIVALREAQNRMRAAAMPGTEFAHAMAILADMIQVRKAKAAGAAQQVTHG
jgi:hypothetical protein